MTFIQLEFQTRAKVDWLDITAEVQRVVAQQEIANGICFLFCPHTTAGLTLNENWDPDVRRDISLVLDRLAPESLAYAHEEGNSPGHAKATLVGNDHFVFVQGGRLQLGTWQGIYLAEFDGPRRRRVWVHVLASES